MSNDDEIALKELALELVKDGRAVDAVRLVRQETGNGLRDAAMRLCVWAEQAVVPLPDLSIFR